MWDSGPQTPGTMCSFQSSSNSVNNPLLIIILIWRSSGPYKSSSYQSLCKSHLDVGPNTSTVWNTQQDSKPLEIKRLFIFNLPGCFISKHSLILGNHQSLSGWWDKSCSTDNKSSDCHEELRLCCKRRASQEGLKSEFNATMFLCHFDTIFYLIQNRLKLFMIKCDDNRDLHHPLV